MAAVSQFLNERSRHPFHWYGQAIHTDIEQKVVLYASFDIDTSEKFLKITV